MYILHNYNVVSRIVLTKYVCKSKVHYIHNYIDMYVHESCLIRSINLASNLPIKYFCGQCQTVMQYL